MGWRQSYETTDSGQRDGAVNEDRTVRFYVDQPAHLAFDPNQVVTSPPEFQSPVNRGDPHPRNIPGVIELWAEDYRVVKQTTNSCEVDVVYSTDGAAYNAALAVQRRSHKREFQIRRVEYKIPIVREKRARPVTAPTTDPMQPEYAVDFVTVKESQPVIQIQVTLTNLTDDDERKIEAQDGAIHLIQGRTGANPRPAQFEAGDVVQHGPGKWKVLYTWYVDRGTQNARFAAEGHAGFPGSANGEPAGLPNPIVYGAVAGQQTRMFFPKLHSSMLSAPGVNGMGLAYTDNRKYIRSPFHEVQYVLHDFDPPSFVQFCNLRIEDDPPSAPGSPGPHNGLGWKLLPGEPQP